MLRRKIIWLVLLIANTCWSGELVKNATVLEVASNGSNMANFAVKIEGGTGVCAGNPSKWIYFPENKAPSKASYNQSFSLATMALAVGNKVRIHNYTSSSCEQADFISVSK